MNSCDPHWEQNNLSRFGEDRYELRCSDPRTCRVSVATTALVENAAPCALRHMVQWQFSAWVISAVTV